MKTTAPYLPTTPTPEVTPPNDVPPEQHSPELAVELNRLETEARVEDDRRKQEELSKLREQARYD